jgi:hypothetical protein
MPLALRKTIVEALGSKCEPADATAGIWTAMRQKSLAEIDAIRAACDVLSTAMAATNRAQRTGAGVTAAILAGERAAHAAGAQDVRILFSLDRGRTLVPFDTLIERPVDPLQVYVAVRRFNYWAEGFARYSERTLAVDVTANAILRVSLAGIKAGTSTAEIGRRIADASTPFRCHPVTHEALASPIGLALEEPPYTDLGAIFEAGEIYSLKVGLTDGVDHHAIASAMIAVHADGNDVLWIENR